MHLGWIDYGVLLLLLGLSAIIGLYHGCIGSKQASANEFLIGNGKMKSFPTSMSLLVSIMSAATLLGVPVEIYSYGTIYLYWMIAGLIASYLSSSLFIPLFRRMGNISIYAYFEYRFSQTTRIVVTSTFILINTIFIAIILYGPSLALSQVTGLHIWFALVSCGLICTFYTSIGGMKAVIWTDFTQAIMILIGIVLSIVFGFIDAGGVRKVFETANAGGRIQFMDASFDLTRRYTIWGLVFGGSFFTTSACACVQTQAQRFLCVKSTRAAQKVVWWHYFLYSIILLLCACVGFLLYAKYNSCDPLQAKYITKPDQLYPLFVLETLGKYPGLTGLFIACILSASLSTSSSAINSIATVILEDIYKKIAGENAISTERQATVSKLLSVAIGLLIIFLTFMASYLSDNIIVIVFQISGSFATPILGLYLLGLFAPRVNSRSALIGYFACLIFQTWILLGANLTASQRIGTDGRLPMSIDGCMSAINISQPLVMNETYISSSSKNILLPLYSISFLWYSFNGVAITVILGLISSFIFGSNNPKTVDKSLLASWKDIFHGGPSNEECELVQTDDKNEMEIAMVERGQML